MLDWPALRFEAMYVAFARRQIADELRSRKLITMGALWANTNLDGEQADRAGALHDLEERYDLAIAAAYGEKVDSQAHGELDADMSEAMDSPLMKKAFIPDQEEVAPPFVQGEQQAGALMRGELR